MNVADVDRADGGLRPVVWGPVVWATGFSIGLKFSLALLFAASFLLMTVRAQDPDTVDVRINAQRHADDRIEFALQTKKDGEGTSSWNDRILPRGRFFPSDPTVGRWLASTMVTIGDASDSVEQMESSAGLTIRIAARRIANGRTEFAIQQLHQDGSWGERQLPSGRFLPADAPLGRWLSSTPLQLTSGSSAPPQAATTLPQPQPEPQATASNDSTPSCTPESVAAEVSVSIAQVCLSTGCGTAFSIGDGEWITAEHVVEQATQVTLRNEHLNVTAAVVGTDENLDLALLSTDRSWPAMSWAETPELGASTLVVGYGRGHSTLSAGVAQGIVSEVIRSNSQTEIRTDAAANPGNSGGPLLDICGNVLGVVQWKLTDSAVDNVAFALATSTVQAALPALRSGGDQNDSGQFWNMTEDMTVAEFMANGLEALLHYAERLRDIDTSTSATAVRGYRSYSEDVNVYTIRLREWYDLSDHGYYCDLARREMANALAHLSRAAQYLEASYSSPTANYLSEFTSEIESAESQVEEAYVSIARCPGAS